MKLLSKVLSLALLSLISAAGATGAIAAFGSRTSKPASAALVAPIMRFGQGKLYVPRDIRISGAEIIVLDEVAPMAPEDNKFVVFSLDGKFKSEFGRGGQGPGEFSQAHAFEVRGGVISVLDSFRQCIQEFSASDKRFLRSVRFGAEQVITTPHDFAALEGGGYVLARPNGIRGEKTLFLIGPDGKTRLSFLEGLPVYDSYEDLREKGNRPDPDTVRKNYANLGYLESCGRTIYHLSWLGNEILAFDFDGKIVNRWTLPLKSLDKTVRVVKEGGFSTIERRLNYGLRCDGGRIWVLSRDEAGQSVLFEIAGGQAVERLRAKETLQDFALGEGRIYALDPDAAEVLVYPLPQVR